VGGTAFARGYTAHHLGAVVEALLGVKGPFFASKALYNEFGVLIH
jgi:hypothetical protein